MEEVTIYKFQLEAIQDVLRITSRLHNSTSKETCFDRSVTQAKKYAENALEGKHIERVPYI